MPRSGLRRFRASAAGLAIVWLGARAGAEPSTAYALTYEPWPGCPSEPAFREDVLLHVHDTSRSAGAKVAVRIEAEPAGFRGELVATDDEGHEGRRSIDGATCTDVAHALAFLAGLAIELGGHLEKSEPPAPPPPVPPTPPPPRETPIPISLKPPEKGGIDYSVLALGEGRTGLAPAIRPALELAFDAEAHRARVLSHSYRLAIVGALSELEHTDGTASLRYLAGRAEGCPLALGAGRLVLRACLAFELGYVWAESHVAANPRNQGQLWPTGETALRLKYGILGGFFAELDVALGVPFLRPKYFFEPARVLYQVPAVTGRAALGLGYRF